MNGLNGSTSLPHVLSLIGVVGLPRAPVRCFLLMNLTDHKSFLRILFCGAVSRICVSRNPVSRKHMSLVTLVPRVAKRTERFHSNCVRVGIRLQRRLCRGSEFLPQVPAGKGISYYRGHA